MNKIVSTLPTTADFLSRPSIPLIITVLTILFLQSSASACSYLPRTYRWTLNLNARCPEQIPLNEGLGLDSDYRISGLTPSTVKHPVKVTHIHLFRFGQDVSVLLNSKEINGNWRNGDVIQVDESIVASDGIFPSGTGIVLEALTAEDETIVMSWLADYTSVCGVNPYANITQIAWLEFVRKMWMFFH